MNLPKKFLPPCTFLLILFFFTVFPAKHCLHASSQKKLKTLYNRIDPSSVTQQFAFYQLSPESNEGKKALKQAWNLLTKKHNIEKKYLHESFFKDPQTIISFIDLTLSQKKSSEEHFQESDIKTIENISQHLGNRQLKGYHTSSEDEILSMLPEDIDLSNNLLISLLGNSESARKKIRYYNAKIDIIALQILARLGKEATPEEKIYAINQYIFHEMRFKFPPESLYNNSIDFYTFLPSVLQSRQGVCLGISTLYLCIAQRLNLNLEVITPPGHIYLRYNNNDNMINIETTARGIHLPTENYLGVNTRELQKRNLKEVIGMNFFNQASVFWQKNQYLSAIQSYEKALSYLPNDPLVLEFLSYNYLAVGKEEKAEKYFKMLSNHSSPYLISKETIYDDYLLGRIDNEGIQIIFTHVDETRESILQKKKNLLKTLKEFPLFRAGFFHLAVTWMQLSRHKEAIEALENYHRIDSTNPSVEYYLAGLYKERFNYKAAWKHYKNAETLLNQKKHNPRALKKLHYQLKILSPK